MLPRFCCGFAAESRVCGFATSAVLSLGFGLAGFYRFRRGVASVLLGSVAVFHFRKGLLPSYRFKAPPHRLVLLFCHFCRRVVASVLLGSVAVFTVLLSSCRFKAPPHRRCVILMRRCGFATSAVVLLPFCGLAGFCD